MAETTRQNGTPVSDVVGVGFGPANLSLAIAVEEHNRSATAADRLSVAFFELQNQFGWHRNMLIDGASVQVSFLKDLVTMRSPTSEFTFLSYLSDRRRLVDFINHKTLFPSRVEFHDYLEWVASRFTHLVRYGATVRTVRPLVGDGGMIRELEVEVRDGIGVRAHRARNLVLATGLEPMLPAGVRTTERVWHSEYLIGNLDRLGGWSPRRIVVVGAGQSAAEIVDYLHRRYEKTEVCAVFSRFGYSPADDSGFVNGIFDPESVDRFYTAPDHVKRSMLDYHANTNYSVVDLELIDELYRRRYQEKVVGKERLKIINLSRVTHSEDLGSRVRVVVQSLVDGDSEVLDADAVVYATGYRPADPSAVLGDLWDLCVRDDRGNLAIGRDYRVVTDPVLRCGVYLQGGTEHAHGLSSGLLSNVAVRAGEVLESILAHPERECDEVVAAVSEYLAGTVGGVDK